MKEIILSNGMKYKVDDEDYEWLNEFTWTYRNDGYAVTFDCSGGRKNQKTIRMHRLIMNCPHDMDVDHKFGDKSDNQKENLRICTAKQNTSNRNKSKSNTSGYKGVTWDKSRNKWVTQIMVNRKNIFLGRFIDSKDAAEAYNKAAIKYFNEYALLNIIKI